MKKILAILLAFLPTLVAAQEHVIVDSVIPGTAATSLGKAEDAGHTTGDTGVMSLGVMQSTPTANGAAGDYVPLQINSVGSAYVDLRLSGAQSSSDTPIKAEDSAFGNGHVVIMNGAKREDTLTANAADLDVQELKSSTEGALYVAEVAEDLNGYTTYSKISTANNNSTNIKASAGRVMAVQVCNVNAAVSHLKLYDKASAPTCGTDTPVMRVIAPVNGCSSQTFPGGAQFTLGIGICIVTGITDADNTSTAANEQVVNITYK